MYDLDGFFAADGRTHIYPVRVFYEDTDAGGVVYHTGYLRFMERARTSMLRSAGRQSDLLAGRGVAFAVRRLTIDFIAPAKLDDTLEVLTKITDIRGASFAAAQRIIRDGRTLTTAEVRVAAVADGRPARLPAAMRDTLENLLGTGPDSPVTHA